MKAPLQFNASISHLRHKGARPTSIIRITGIPGTFDYDPGTMTRFIIEGLDDNMPGGHYGIDTERLQAAMLLKDDRGRFNSLIGKALLDVRQDVIAYLNEHANDSDELEFYREEGGNFVINIIGPHVINVS